jgi:hypothetical protein
MLHYGQIIHRADAMGDGLIKGRHRDNLSGKRSRERCSGKA